MANRNVDLSRKLTRESSIQSYITALLLVDKDLQEDCLRAYAYFRWVDDQVDDPKTSFHEREAFINRQKLLVDSLYKNQKPKDLSSFEEIIGNLISHDRGFNSGLRSFVDNFIRIIEFDAHRKNQLISQEQLDWYSQRLGIAVTDAIQYFVRNGHPYPDGENRYAAATAAHITHMLRDMRQDIDVGYFNFPAEYSDYEIDSHEFKEWVRSRVLAARDGFRLGKSYIDSLDVLRCKLAGYWYCTRFEDILDVIEADAYHLRENYSRRYKISVWLRMVQVGLSIAAKHLSAKSISKLSRRERSLRQTV